MAKNKNPYHSSSSYSETFEDLRTAGNTGVTRAELITNHPVADVTVVLSPRKEGAGRGDCRGNMSAAGHVYFVDKRKKEGESARFVLRWRKKVLDRHVRPVKVNKTSQKAKAKVAKKVDAVVTPVA